MDEECLCGNSSKRWGQLWLYKCLVDTGLGFQMRGYNNNVAMLLFTCYLLDRKLNSIGHDLWLIVP